jgi:hypothetical protein
VRHLERLAPEYIRDLRSTVAGYSAIDCLRALRACVQLYRSLRPGASATQSPYAAERAVMQYLSSVEQRCDRASGKT